MRRVTPRVQGSGQGRQAASWQTAAPATSSIDATIADRGAEDEPADTAESGTDPWTSPRHEPPQQSTAAPSPAHCGAAEARAASSREQQPEPEEPGTTTQAQVKRKWPALTYLRAAPELADRQVELRSELRHLRQRPEVDSAARHHREWRRRRRWRRDGRRRLRPAPGHELVGRGVGGGVADREPAERGGGGLGAVVEAPAPDVIALGPALCHRRRHGQIRVIVAGAECVRGRGVRAVAGRVNSGSCGSGLMRRVGVGVGVGARQCTQPLAQSPRNDRHRP